MKCPHCLKEIHGDYSQTGLGEDVEGIWFVEAVRCPACKKGTFTLLNFSFEGEESRVLQFRPLGPGRPPMPQEVQAESPEIADDYKEACLVLPLSPKASAALSRRCLQHLLRAKAKVKASSLAKEIEQVLEEGNLPTQLRECVDAVRNIGNLSAHPEKDTATGEIVDVEVGEAEWNLDVLEGLFDFYYVQPARLKAKRDAMDAKLAAVGKPPLKG